MRVVYVYSDNTRFLISIVASCIDHQINLAISHYEALIEGFPMHVYFAVLKDETLVEMLSLVSSYRLI